MKQMKWTLAQLEEIKHLHEEMGYPASRIAILIGIPEDKIKTQLMNIDKAISRRKKRKPRSCLKCKKKFASTGAHNRLCPSCSITNSRESAPSDFTLHI